MADLANGQFEIDGVLFGGVWDNIKIREVTFPEADWSVQDADNQFRPGTFMGQDLLRPGEFIFSLVTDGSLWMRLRMPLTAWLPFGIRVGSAGLGS